MLELMTRPFVRLVSTGPEVERLPFIRRPRTTAATWGGLLACKLGAMLVISPVVGAGLFAVTLAAGIVATYARFGQWRPPASAAGALTAPASA